MGCGDSTASQPAKQATVNVIDQPKATKLTGVADLVCTKCGLVLPDANMPDHHPCDGIFRPTYIDDRRRLCGICPGNDNGICQPLKDAHNDWDCNIEVGTEILSAHCPKFHWLAMRLTCPSCKARLWDDGGVHRCECGWTGTPPQPMLMLKPRPFVDEPIKHLHFFIWPRDPATVAYHLQQIRASIHIFNGRTRIVVATDRRTCEADFMGDIKDLFDEVIELPNDPKKGELVGFMPMMDRAVTDNPDHCICYAHGKGMRERLLTSEPVRNWTDALYEKTVRNWDGVQAAFEAGYPLAGSFKVRDHFGTTYGWHYSGAFYWMRAAALFAHPQWREINQDYYGTESYFGKLFLPVEGFCLYADHQGGTYAGTWQAE